MDFQEVVMARHAARSFTGEEIPKDKVDALMDLIRHAPTSFNLQPWKVRVIADAETKQKLKGASRNQPQITSCSHLFVFCANTDLESLADRLEAGLRDAGTPKESLDKYIAAIRRFIGSLEGDRRLAWAQRQTYLALGNGVNGAKALGFDSCPMEGFRPAEYAKILDLPESLVPTALMTIGVASDKPRPKYRFPKEEMFF